MKFYEIVSNIKYRNIHFNPQKYSEFTRGWVRDMLYRNINRGNKNEH